MPKPRKPSKPNETHPQTPRFCDLTCPYAEWPQDDALDGARSCRTFAALYCRKLRRVVAKNGRCACG